MEDLLAGYVAEADAAKKLRRTKRALQRWRYRQVGPPFVRVGVKIYYNERELQKWIDAGGTAHLRKDANNDA